MSRWMTVPVVVAVMGIVLALAGEVFAAAAEAEPVRIGYVDMDRVAANSKMVKQRISDVEGELTDRQKEYRAKTEELRKLRQQLQQQESILTEQQKEQIAARIRKLRDEMQFLQYQADKVLSDTSRDVIEPVLDQVLMAVERVAKTYKIDIVLRGDLVLFASERVDLTDHVIKELDRAAAGAPAKQVSPADAPIGRPTPTPADAKKPTPKPKP